MKITRTSMFSNIERTKDLPITEDQLKDWNNGTVIQKAMPNLSCADREFIITGVTDEEWQKQFKE
jgi:hypothetical protein